MLSDARCSPAKKSIVPRISDVYAAIPSMTGKMELEYEGEQLGANRIARDLIKRAAGRSSKAILSASIFRRTVQWFDEGNKLLLADTAAASECGDLIEAVPELLETAMIPFDFQRSDTAQLVSACELVLEGLYAENKISRNEEGSYAAVARRRKIVAA